MVKPLVHESEMARNFLNIAHRLVRIADSIVIPVKLKMENLAARYADKRLKGEKLHMSHEHEHVDGKDPHKFMDEQKAKECESSKLPYYERIVEGGNVKMDEIYRGIEQVISGNCKIQSLAVTVDETRKVTPRLMEAARGSVGLLMLEQMVFCEECIDPELHDLKMVSRGGTLGFSSIAAVCLPCIGDSFRAAAKSFAETHRLNDVVLTQTTSFHWTAEEMMKRVKVGDRDYKAANAAKNDALTRANDAMKATIPNFCTKKPDGNISVPVGLERCYGSWCNEIVDISYKFIRDLKAVSEK